MPRDSNYPLYKSDKWTIPTLKLCYKGIPEFSQGFATTLSCFVRGLWWVSDTPPCYAIADTEPPHNSKKSIRWAVWVHIHTHITLGATLSHTLSFRHAECSAAYGGSPVSLANAGTERVRASTQHSAIAFAFAPFPQIGLPHGWRDMLARVSKLCSLQGYAISRLETSCSLCIAKG